MKNYYRATVYNKEYDFSAILDCYDLFEQMWGFSAMLVEKGFNIMEIGKPEIFGEGNTPITDKHPNKIIVRATQDGKPNYKHIDANDLTKKDVCVSFRYYMPKK